MATGHFSYFNYFMSGTMSNKHKSQKYLVHHDQARIPNEGTQNSTSFFFSHWNSKQQFPNHHWSKPGNYSYQDINQIRSNNNMIQGASDRFTRAGQILNVSSAAGVKRWRRRGEERGVRGEREGRGGEGGGGGLSPGRDLERWRVGSSLPAPLAVLFVGGDTTRWMGGWDLGVGNWELGFGMDSELCPLLTSKPIDHCVVTRQQQEGVLDRNPYWAIDRWGPLGAIGSGLPLPHLVSFFCHHISFIF